MRNTGAVPVPYIVALVLAIIVLAIIAYWLFFSSHEFGGIITEKGCEVKKMSYCSEWKTVGTQPAELGFAPTSCDVTDKDKYYAPECCIFEWARGSLKSDCGISE